jgi:hypothetical protein
MPSPIGSFEFWPRVVVNFLHNQLLTKFYHFRDLEQQVPQKNKNKKIIFLDMLKFSKQYFSLKKKKL